MVLVHVPVLDATAFEFRQTFLCCVGPCAQTLQVRIRAVLLAGVDDERVFAALHLFIQNHRCRDPEHFFHEKDDGDIQVDEAFPRSVVESCDVIEQLLLRALAVIHLQTGFVTVLPVRRAIDHDVFDFLRT